jgi:hypothetical protein
MNAYNRQNILASLTSGFKLYPRCSLPTDGQCHVLVHMFGVTYSVAISIDQLVEPVIDDVGFVYHGVIFENERKVYDKTNGVMSFALMLPHRDKEGYLR